MVDRRDVASWLDGPRAYTKTADDYPGKRLGMPQQGPGSIARFGRRLAAICIDWTICQLVSVLFFRIELGHNGSGAFAPLGVFAVMNILMLPTMGSTVGQRLLGVGLMSLGGRPAALVQVLIRTLLLCLVIPAVIWDRDGRGLHDKAAQTVLVRR